jgi:hypothetical protein
MSTFGSCAMMRRASSASSPGLPSSTSISVRKLMQNIARGSAVRHASIVAYAFTTLPP